MSNAAGRDRQFNHRPVFRCLLPVLIVVDAQEKVCVMKIEEVPPVQPPGVNEIFNINTHGFFGGASSKLTGEIAAGHVKKAFKFTLDSQDQFADLFEQNGWQKAPAKAMADRFIHSVNDRLDVTSGTFFACGSENAFIVIPHDAQEIEIVLDSAKPGPAKVAPKDILQSAILLIAGAGIAFGLVSLNKTLGSIAAFIMFLLAVLWFVSKFSDRVVFSERGIAVQKGKLSMLTLLSHFVGDIVLGRGSKSGLDSIEREGRVWLSGSPFPAHRMQGGNAHDSNGRYAVRLYVRPHNYIVLKFNSKAEAKDFFERFAPALRQAGGEDFSDIAR
jgi:hypothetical protein